MQEDKPGETKLKIVSTENRIKKRMFSIRRIIDNKISPGAIMLATACATDANTKFYVDEYQKGHLSVREDYIAYMADKFQFLMNGGKL